MQRLTRVFWCVRQLIRQELQKSSPHLHPKAWDWVDGEVHTLAILFKEKSLSLIKTYIGFIVRHIQ